MYLKTVLMVGLLAAFVDADCSETCVTTYINSVVSHASSQTLICKDIENFVHCLFGTGCKTSGISEKAILEYMNKYLELYGFSCSFSTADLYNKYKNSGTRLSSVSVSVVLIMSLGITGLRWIIRSLQVFNI